MIKILCIAEKSDMAFKYAAALGGVYLEDNSELTTKDLIKREGYVKSQSKRNNGFKGVATRSALKGCEITYSWARGHLVNLYQASDYDKRYSKWTYDNFPIIPSTFLNKTIETPYTINQFNYLKNLLNSKFDFVINGTDAEREGELIFFRIYELSKSNLPVKRLWVNSTKEEDIINQFSNLLESNPYLLDAAKARAYSDWLYGINYTVLYSLKTNVKTPIGRVKLPTLKLIVDRYKEFSNFKSEKHYQLNAYVKKDNQLIKFTLEDKFNNKPEVEILKEKLESINRGYVSNIENNTEKELAPSFYSLSTLQADANSIYGYTLSETLDIAQSLYSNTYITYPRSDSSVIPISEEDNMKARIQYIPEHLDCFKNIALKNIQNGLKLNSKYVKDTSSAHFAIVVNNTAENLKKDQNDIYELICKSVLAPFLGPATWNSSAISLKLNEFIFIAKERTLGKKGFRELILPKKDSIKFPAFNLNENLFIDSFEIEEKESKPRQLFTDKSLVLAMENIKNVVDEKEFKEILTECKGIGTGATRAALLQSLIDANYIERKKKSLIPTELGINVIDNFPVEDLKSPITTAKWEMRFNNMTDGNESLNHMLEDIKNDIISNCEIIKNMQSVNWGNENREILGKCPMCGGNIIEGKKGYGCSNWREKECKFVIWKSIAKKNISKLQVKKLLEAGKTDYIQGFKSNKGASFGAYLILDEDYKVSFKFKDKGEVLGKCPMCDGNVVEANKGYGCSNWKEKECKFVIWKNIYDKDISKLEVKKLLETGKTDYIENFKSKKGTSFGAYLILDENHKVSFRFKDKEECNHEIIGKCPMCNGNIVDEGSFFTCTDCDLKIYKSIAGYSLEEKDIQDLLKYKRTHKLDGFKSKKGKLFSAYLIINKNKVEFEF